MTKCFRKLKIIVDPEIPIFERNYVLMIICGLQINGWDLGEPEFYNLCQF